MKFTIVVMYILSASLVTFSQNNSISIIGTVRSNDNNEPIENAGIYLKSSSGLMIEDKTDTLGNYHFEIENDTSSTIEISCHTDKLTKSATSSKCGWLANADIAKAKLKPNTNIVKDFTLVRILDCGSVPYIIFYKNSTKSCNDSLYQIDPIKYVLYEHAISLYEETLKANPEIIIEISGNASSNEKGANRISLKRARSVKRILVSKGVNSKRIYIKGNGCKKLLVTDKMIYDVRSSKTPSEIEAMHSKNRRVIFRIIGWDFKE